ncbi:MAG: hypothetical protein ACREH4_15905 [Vitreimonas sp.]
MKRIVIVAALAALGGCASAIGVATRGGSTTIPSTPVNLGDWRNASESATLSAFQQGVASRYGAGLAVTAVSADLRRNSFNCGAAPRAQNGRGDPPAQVCRRTLTNGGCTHTWQVHLFDESGSGELARTRGLYDRRCGGDGLLGGPG